MDLSPLKQIFNNHIDIILANTGLTIPCTLVYEGTKLTVCPNCQYDTISKKSANLYKGGGPLPFANGQTCPYCLGAGTTNSQMAEDAVYFAVLTDSKNFVGAVNSPEIEASGTYTIEGNSISFVTEETTTTTAGMTSVGEFELSGNTLSILYDRSAKILYEK